MDVVSDAAHENQADTKRRDARRDVAVRMARSANSPPIELLNPTDFHRKLTVPMR